MTKEKLKMLKRTVWRLWNKEDLEYVIDDDFETQADAVESADAYAVILHIPRDYIEVRQEEIPYNAYWETLRKETRHD